MLNHELLRRVRLRWLHRCNNLCWRMWVPQLRRLLVAVRSELKKGLLVLEDRLRVRGKRYGLVALTVALRRPLRKLVGSLNVVRNALLSKVD